MGNSEVLIGLFHLEVKGSISITLCQSVIGQWLSLGHAGYGTSWMRELSLEKKQCRQFYRKGGSCGLTLRAAGCSHPVKEICVWLRYSYLHSAELWVQGEWQSITQHSYHLVPKRKKALEEQVVPGDQIRSENISYDSKAPIFFHGESLVMSSPQGP